MKASFHNKDIPETLFNYRRFDEDNLNLRLLAENEIYFPSPNSFNDPFDPYATFQFDHISNEHIIVLTEKIMKDSPLLSFSEARLLAKNTFKKSK
jgi:hypothetical protein